MLQCLAYLYLELCTNIEFSLLLELKLFEYQIRNVCQLPASQRYFPTAPSSEDKKPTYFNLLVTQSMLNQTFKDFRTSKSRISVFKSASFPKTAFNYTFSSRPNIYFQAPILISLGVMAVTDTGTHTHTNTHTHTAQKMTPRFIL
jgi:hypothetical protein